MSQASIRKLVDTDWQLEQTNEGIAAAAQLVAARALERLALEQRYTRAVLERIDRRLRELVKLKPGPGGAR